MVGAKIVCQESLQVPTKIQTSGFSGYRSQSGCFCPRWGMPDDRMGSGEGTRVPLWAAHYIVQIEVYVKHHWTKYRTAKYSWWIPWVCFGSTSKWSIDSTCQTGHVGSPALLSRPAEVVCSLHVWQASIHFPWIQHWPTSRWICRICGLVWCESVNGSGCCYKLVSRYFVVKKGDNGSSGRSLLKGSPNIAKTCSQQ